MPGFANWFLNQTNEIASATMETDDLALDYNDDTEPSIATKALRRITDVDDGELSGDSDSEAEDEATIARKVAEHQAKVRRERLSEYALLEPPPEVCDDDTTELLYDDYRPRARIDPSLTLCKFFLRGRCMRGDYCAFLHQIPCV